MLQNQMIYEDRRLHKGLCKQLCFDTHTHTHTLSKTSEMQNINNIHSIDI